MAVTGRRIHVFGRVQGVGFRPFVWRLAREFELLGEVRNDGSGVWITAWGPEPALDAFIARVKADPPPLARVASVDWTPLDASAPQAGFRIQSSSGDGAIATEIAPDAATCADCLADICTPKNRRFRYAFTTCTNCGPRMSITRAIPYDRATTSMGRFQMCDVCGDEYGDPADRRFHTQPIACATCGPRLWLEGRDGEIACADPITAAAKRLRDGAIIAIKGIGGFHLACDAMNADAVAELRRRKHRPAKPLAIMARDLGQIRRICHVSDADARLLASPIAPIVLLGTKIGAALPGIAPALDVMGVMLPYSPIHHMLMAALEAPIVLTSGNISGAPQATENAAARQALSGIADAWLMHDRDIVHRLDDSVMRVDLAAPVVLRRGRGLTPEAIELNAAFADAPPILALGGEQKSTICLLKDGKAILSQHIGDLTSVETYADFRDTVDAFRDLYRFDPQVIAIDRHPEYLSSKWGHDLARAVSAPVVSVQHHHAHLASCLAEHKVAPDQDSAVGIVLDGTGLGLDGTVWGGEILVGGYAGFDRKAHLQQVALPGGSQAIREPWRNTLAHLHAVFGPTWQAAMAGTPLSASLCERPVDLVMQMITWGVNSPLSSSAGRLFDAVAGALGLCFDRQSYEGQAAMALESLARPHIATAGAYPGAVADTGVISLEPFWSALVQDLKSNRAPGEISARFHNGLASILAETAAAIASHAGTSRVVLSGGVMQNRLLLTGLHDRLAAAGLEVLVHRRVPANDGGLSLGQAAVAALQSHGALERPQAGAGLGAR